MKKIFILLTVFMGLSCSTRETKFNETLWKHPVNDYTRSNMVDDVIKIITENNYSENDVIKMLGKPDFTDDLFHKSTTAAGDTVYRPRVEYGYIYVLFGNQLVSSALRIEFINELCSKAFVLQGD